MASDLDRHVNVVQHLGMILDGGAGGEEDHDFLSQVPLQEGEQEQEALF